jgi:4-diphosphocytidyl-2-C-methyl-D-erythritol kinase
MFSLGLGTADLERRAARLGADCAFFIQNRPAYATGIGDQLEPIEWKVESGKWKVVIEIPDGEHVSTKEAYAGIDRSRFGQPRPDLREAIRHPIEEWRDLIVNDFETSVFPAHPAIAAFKEKMYRRGALYASMTGSGAAVFGIFAV